MSELLKVIRAKRNLLANRPENMSLADARAIVGELLDRAIQYDQSKLEGLYCIDDFGLSKTPDRDTVKNDILYYQNIVADPEHQFTARQKEIAAITITQLNTFLQSI